MSSMCGVFSKRVLHSTSGRKLRTAAIAYIWEISSNALGNSAKGDFYVCHWGFTRQSMALGGVLLIQRIGIIDDLLID